jgi:Uma2 family endonuclease
MATQPLPYVTPEQYLEYDRNAEFKSEYFFGEIESMAGGTARHARIAAKVIEKQLPNGPWQAFSSDLRVCLNKKMTYVYPDVTSFAGHPST